MFKVFFIGLKNWIVIARDFLNRNKVFYEVIVAFLLSLMAIKVSCNANKIAETQTKIMEQESLPQIEIRGYQGFNQEKKVYDNTTFLVYNRGGKLSDFSIENMTFIRFVPRGIEERDKMNIPIYGYFGMQGVLSGDAQDLVYSFDTDHQDDIEVNLRDSLSNKGYLQIESYVKVSYADISDQTHFEYFFLRPTSVKISEKEWEEHQNIFDDNDKLSFPKLTASKLDEYITSHKFFSKKEIFEYKP